MDWVFGHSWLEHVRRPHLVPGRFDSFHESGDPNIELNWECPWYRELARREPVIFGIPTPINPPHRPRIHFIFHFLAT